jgi:hypothetical protein
LWEGYDSAAAEGLAPILPAPLEVAREHTLDEASLDAQIAEHGERRIDETIELAAFLGTSIERRSVRRIRIERGVRKVIFAGILVMLVVEAIQHRPKTANLALHANVVASSRRPGSGPPANLTNGVPEPAASFATKDEPDPWVTIDLGPAARVSEVTLFDGSDHVDDILPMKLETSGDGTQWDPAAVETTRFTPEAPAVLTFTTRGVRFVRIHGRPNGAIYLSEVEVR